uniref:DUF4461 domain-containing protein n=1 Tax=Caenorhabditis japonica TaxID=281687 RepID=A0A8R1I4K7_CAEJA
MQGCVLSRFLLDIAGVSLNNNRKISQNELEFARDECIQELKLTGLKWEPTFQPDTILSCVNRLTHCSDDVRKLVSGLSLIISTNPSIYVTNDGTLSIPLNWS